MQPSSDITEAAKHKRYIELLAEETDHPPEEVGPVYDDIYTELKKAADIPDYVPVFAWRRARARLMAQ